MNGLAARLRRWRDNPPAFVREAIGAVPDPWQTEAMMRLLRHKRLSIAACHGPGKDALAAWLILWMMFCWPHPKIPCSAPTSHQLYDLLWSEIQKWLVRMPKPFQALVELKSERFERKAYRKTWFAVARTAKAENSEGLQGFHADNLLVVLDESSGVPDSIFEVLEGAMTGPHCFMLLIGNPTQTQGFFFDSHHTDSARWYRMRIMAEAAHDGQPLPEGVWTSPRITPEYVEGMRTRYGLDSNVYRVRVLGEFPKSDDDQTIPLEWIEAAGMREQYEAEPDSIVIGVDVARFGSDDSAVCIREGRNILFCDRWNGNDLVSTTRKVIRIAEEYEKRLDPLDTLYFCVDSVGLGAGVADMLRAHVAEKSLRWAVMDVDASRSSRDPNCARKRDELWWLAREYFRSSEPSIGSFDPEIRSQLMSELATPKYSFTPSGTIKIEGKDELEKRGIASPNLADSLINTLEISPKRRQKPKPCGWRDTETPENDWMTG